MTALIGILVGIYAGMVPSIQYYIVDYNHYAIMGNFWMYLGLAIPVAFLWPLPMLHGRKPYMIGSLSIATPLLFPQAIAVQDHNTPWIVTWRVLVLLGRACMGFALGFAAMNSFALLTDVYGCSLVKNHDKDDKSGHDHRNSHRVNFNLPPAVAGPRNERSPDDSISPTHNQNPSQQPEPTPSPPSPPSNQNEEQDPKLHGGGMDVWLGVWTFSFLGSIATGFCVGAAIIENHPPVVGMYVSIALVSLIIFLAVLCPEVRYPRTSASYVVSSESSEVRHAAKVFGRGQVKMHREGSPPKNAGEEIWAGMLLMRDLLSMPGFLILALYYSWVYGQFVLIMVLLSALASRDYRLHAPWVGLSVLAIGAGSLLAFPLGTENPILTYLGLKEAQPRDDDAFWHFGECRFKRRVVFVTVLPVMTAVYAGVSAGPPTPLGIPILFAGCVGFFCTLAVMECNGLIMEAFDTSDHDHSMIGRARHVKGRAQGVPTNYSAFPRVCAAFAVCHAGGFMVAAFSTAVGGAMTRNWGARVVAGVMAGMLVLVGGALLVVLVRWKGMVLEKTGHDGELKETKPRSAWMSGWLTRWGEGYEGRRRRMRSKRGQDE